MRVTYVLRLTVSFVALALSISGAPQEPGTEFMSLDAAQPTLKGFHDELPPELRGTADPRAWSAWVRKQDAGIRQRLEKGEEDTLTNLLRWGVTFTDEYQINREYLSKYGTSTLVNAFAEKRSNDLVRALSSPGANEGMQ